MSNKRLLILTNRVPYPLKDGGNLAMKAMVDGYNSNGYEVYLLSMNTTRHYIDEQVAKGVYSDIYAFDTVKVDNNLHTLATLKNFLFSKEANHVMRFRNSFFQQKLQEVLRSFDPDFVQIESIYLSTYLSDIRSQSKAKTILRLHNIEYQVWDRLAGEVNQPLKKFYLQNLAKRIRKFEQQAWGQYDMLLPITKEDEQIVKQLLPTARSYVVPFTINTFDIKPKVEEKWVDYHIGAMDWLPNVEGLNWFLGIWSFILKRSPEFKFYFAGRNMPESFKARQIDNVTCVGEVEDAEAFIADKKILIVPLRSGGGIRVKILEAMAMSKIVISTDIGMQGITAEANKHYIPANTIEEFATGIEWVLGNKDQAERIADNAKLLVRDIYESSSVYQTLTQRLISI